MSKQANPALIGGFVLGAVALLVGFVLVFGGGRLFRDVTEHVVYFEGTISGLRVGANVNFRGVRIGEVTDISVVYDVAELSFSIPVVIEIDNRRLVLAGTRLGGSTMGDMLDLIDKGLRAQLQVQSFVTGLLDVQIDIFPESEAVYRGEGPPFEVPTLPSPAQVMVERAQNFITELQEMPLQEFAEAATSAAEGLDRLANSPDTQALPGSIRRSLRELDATVVEVREELAGDSDLYHRVSAALDEVASAARALRLLAEYLEQNPEAVVRGRQNR
ncbi:MAG: MCE family protein [Deltaproteobacteria bacterium]|nr:MCE family protein [Deltaproteobacteria bacterium]